jgi:hypothetical protein
MCNAAQDSFIKIVEYVHDLSYKWFHLGLSLGLHYHTLKNIEASHHHDVGEHMTDMLLKWLRGTGLETTEGVKYPPSWRSLARALGSPLVNMHHMACKIMKEHPISK